MNKIKLKGTYAKINLDNIVRNYMEACKLVGDQTQVTCVVKSDAYGHGEKQVIRALMDSGLKLICVSTIIEGVRLRKTFKDIDILVLGYTPLHLLQQVSKHNLIQAISSLEEAKHLNNYGHTKVHIKVNTGMNRLGYSWINAQEIVATSQLENIEICGIFSHLHSSDAPEKSASDLQFMRYKEMIYHLEEQDVECGIKHICNSGGIIDLKHMHLDMVRQGIMLYGLYPSNEMLHNTIHLKEAMSYHSYIASLKSVYKGEGVSYGHDYIADHTMKVATVNVGYSDGVFRNLANKGEVIIRDQRCKIVGRVCMNMIMVDVTDVQGVTIEDEVILFGKSANQFISIDEVAEWAGTISYEIVCRTGYSVPRVYVRHGEVLEIENDFLEVK